MIILQDSQIKKIFHNGDEVKKILDWDGNVIFYKQSGGGGMTNDIKFTTSPSVSSANVFTVTYTDSTQDTLSYSEPSKEYTLSIPTDKVVTKIDLDDYYVDEVTVSCKINLSDTFFTNKPKTIRLLNCDATSSTSMDSIFADSKYLETIEMKDLDARNVTSMSGMFSNCYSATTIDIANWNTSSVTKLVNVFKNCKKVTTLNLSSWNTSNVTSMWSMFEYCESLTSLDLSNWDTSNVKEMSYMFKNCSSITYLDLSHFNTGEVYDMQYMFSRCTGLESLDISGFDMTRVTSTTWMFEHCNKLTTIRMVGCNKKAIDNIKYELNLAGIQNNVTIITE